MHEHVKPKGCIYAAAEDDIPDVSYPCAYVANKLAVAVALGGTVRTPCPSKASIAWKYVTYMSSAPVKAPATWERM